MYLLNRQAAFNIHAQQPQGRSQCSARTGPSQSLVARNLCTLCLQLRRATQRRAIWITWGTMRHATLPITTHDCTADAHYKTPTESGGGNILTQQRRNPIQLPDTESIMSLTNATPLGSRKMTPGLHTITGRSFATHLTRLKGREITPKPRSLAVREPIFTITNVPKR